jgi:RNA polymerase sigma-70 factor (ECF subfamily)
MDIAFTQTDLNLKSADDFSLIQEARNGEQKAFSILLDRYRDAIFRTVLKMVHNKEDADDLTIEAFGKAFHKLESYQPKYAFSTWLFRIAINNCIDHIRKKRLNFLSIDEPVDDTAEQDFAANLKSYGLNPEECIIRSQRMQLTRSTLEKLNLKYRLMIELRYFEELSYDEISTELDMPIGTVKAQLHRAREAMYELLSQPGASDYLEVVRRKK